MPFLEGEEEGVGYLLADGLEERPQGSGVGRGAAEADKQERLGGPQPLVGGPVRRHAKHGGLPGAARAVHHVRTSGRSFKKRLKQRNRTFAEYFKISLLFPTCDVLLHSF
jgi:hypothetical protein